MPEYDSPDDMYLPPFPYEHEGRQSAEDNGLYSNSFDINEYPLLPPDEFGEEGVMSGLLSERPIIETRFERPVITRQPSAEFLHSRNKRFHTSVGVEAVVGYMRSWCARVPNEPADKISAYMELLADPQYACDGLLNGNLASIHRQVTARVMAAEDIPDAYYELQERADRGQRAGYAEPRTREQIVETVQADQYSSALRWAKHFGASGEYPPWFSTYVWDAVGKMGRYDKQADEFMVRSHGTTAPYPELNAKAVAYVYKALDQAWIKKQDTDHDPELQQLVRAGNFSKLYVRALRDVTAEAVFLRQNIEGSWTSFDWAVDADASDRLVNSLQGYGTGWCVVNEGAANKHLHRGSLHIYRSADQEGGQTIPRVAVQMMDGYVFEIRGVSAHQEIETEVLGVLKEQLKEMPGGEAYMRKVDDRVKLAAMDKRIVADPAASLSTDDVRFLYEIDRAIEGFGIERDPRIAELRRMRGDLDRSEVARIVPEAIGQQLDAAYDGYRSLIGQIMPDTTFKSTLSQHLESAHGIPAFAKSWLETPPSVARQSVAKRHFDHIQAKWQKDGTYNYVVDRIMEGSGGFTLVATPTIAMNMGQIIGGCKDIGTRTQREAIEMGNAIIDLTQELYESKSVINEHKALLQQENDSSPLGVGPVRFSLIPTVEDAELSFETPAEIKRKLAERQAKYAGVGIRMPTLLDAVSYWQGLRARGEDLNTDSMQDIAQIAHVGLYERPQLYVTTPEVVVSGIHDGIPFFERALYAGSLFVRPIIG